MERAADGPAVGAPVSFTAEGVGREEGFFFKIFFIFLFIYLRQGGKERVRVSMSRGGRAEADSL